jgi:hypothetical protein
MKVISLLWLRWLERNSSREGNCRRATEDLAYIIQKNAVEYLNICKANKGGKEVRGKLKINSDGTFAANTCQGGWGFVIRDAAGEVVHAG